MMLIVASNLTFARLGEPTKRFDEHFRKYSKRYFGPGFEWQLFKAQAMAESGLDTTALSGCGARGLMQLMPSTFDEIGTKNPDFVNIDDPRWNIAAGIYYDRKLWTSWGANTGSASDRFCFMFASYNAGKRTIMRAQDSAKSRTLDYTIWPSIETVAANVPKWRHEETLGYVDKIQKFYVSISLVKPAGFPGSSEKSGSSSNSNTHLDSP